MIEIRRLMMVSAFVLTSVSVAAPVWADVAPVVSIDSSEATSSVPSPDAVVPNGDPANGSTPVDAAPSSPNAQESLTVEQRLALVERTLKNLTDMNFPAQITDLRNQVQQLQGQLQVQAHDLQLLNNQQRSFYQDTDQRIQQLKTLSGSTGKRGMSDTEGSPDPSATMTPSSSQSDAASQESAQISETSVKDTTLYQRAFSLMAKKQYPEALQAFQQYLDHFPKGGYAANARYWLGEIHLQQGQTTQALDAFKAVIQNDAKSNKVPDARLKLAMIYMSQGKRDLALQEYQTLKRQYPNTTAAQLASIQMQRMQVESTS